MSKYSFLDNANPDYVDQLYTQYLQDPNSVDRDWQKFFEGFEFSSQTQTSPSLSSHHLREIAVTKLINAYRQRGHLISDTNPVRRRRTHKVDLELDYFGLGPSDMNTEFDAGAEVGIGRATLTKILDHLKATYSGHIGVEFMYCRNESLRQWLLSKMEPIANQPQFSLDEKKHILKKIDQAVTFEQFLQTKYIGKKRFSLEGSDALIPALDAAIRQSAELGVSEFVLGMAHRGRLNVLVNIFGKSYEDLFSEFEGTTLPETIHGDADVKYHLGHSADIVTENGYQVHLSLVPNPSHLEAVNPVVEGIVYAKKLEIYGNDAKKIIPIMIHGDAAISGQGVNYEVAQMSRLDGYSVGGTVHIVINNQLGFTATNREGRSSIYCTDLAKVTDSPVFHVNADDLLMVVHAVQMAVKIREIFGIDVFVDILGYRKYGHNEGDEPRFTQPSLYESLKNHRNVRDLFVQELVKNGDITEAEAASMSKEFQSTLQLKLDEVQKKRRKINVDFLHRYWQGLRVATPEDFKKSIPTGVNKETLEHIATSIFTPPNSIQVFTKLKKLLLDRKNAFFEKQTVDWGSAELLAYGSLLYEGFPVRLSGQDSQRGTFSHRHAVLRDIETDETYTPLNHISDTQALFQVHNSFLSEYCVLGFEFGYSWSRPKTLVIWEAQFGDFANGAQIMIDQFISSSESKWQRMSGLVMLLPHGYEGQGPEHSSARPERFLQLCAENNMIVADPTTPANFFHLLRRQIKNQFRKPLIVFTPKSLLRHPLAISPVSALTTGQFQEVIAEQVTNKIKKVIFCTGKIYYDLFQKRERDNRKDVMIVRIEQLYPFPKNQIDALIADLKTVKEWVWAQEEPINMGPWHFITQQMPDLALRCISRIESASPATGIASIHETNQAKIVDSAFE